MSSISADIHFRNRALLLLMLSCFLFKEEMKKILLDAQELMVKWQAANPDLIFSHLCMMAGQNSVTLFSNPRCKLLL